MSVTTESRSRALLLIDHPNTTPDPSAIPRSVTSVFAGIGACVGVFSVAEADIRSRASASGSYALFWLGIALIFVPIAWQLCRRTTTRNERLILALVFGLALYLVKCLYSPTSFVFTDEFAHVRTVINLRNSGHLFGWNPEIRAAADYPGLALVTLSLVKVSGLSIVTSGMVVIGVGRLLLMLSVFLLLERLTGSSRAAGVGCLIYAGNANFLYWSAQFAYESLALPLALAAAYLILRRSDGAKREVVPALLIAAMVVITHHLTAYALFGLLVAWSVVALISRRHGHPRQYAPIAPALLVGVGAALWLGLAARQTLGYLLPVFDVIVVQGVNLLLHHKSSKALFANSGGPVEPLWERVVAFASVLLIVAFVLIGLVRRWRRSAHPLTSVLMWTSLLYVLMLPLAITGEGQEALVRSGEFLFVGVAILLATTLVARKAGASHARSRWFGDGLGRAWRRVRAARTTTAFVVCLVIFTGGISLSWSYAKRLSPPPQVNGPPAIVTPDDIAAARWLLGEYGPNHRIATDFTTGLAFDTYGDQNVLSGASDGAHVWRIFFPLTMTRSVYQELSASNVEFVVVQKQLTEGGPPPAYAVPFFDDGEPGNEDHRPVSVISQEKFASAAAFSMVYRSATITIYRVHQSRVRAATGSA